MWCFPLISVYVCSLSLPPHTCILRQLTKSKMNWTDSIISHDYNVSFNLSFPIVIHSAIEVQDLFMITFLGYKV